MRLVLILHYGKNFTHKKISTYQQILMKHAIKTYIVDNSVNVKKLEKKIKKYNEIIILTESTLNYEAIMKKLSSMNCQQLIESNSNKIKIIPMTEESFEKLKLQKTFESNDIIVNNNNNNNNSSSNNNNNNNNNTNDNNNSSNKRPMTTTTTAAIKDNKRHKTSTTTTTTYSYPSLCCKVATTIETAEKNKHIISAFEEYYKLTKAYKTQEQRIQEFTLPRVLSVLRGLPMQISFQNIDLLKNINYIGKTYQNFIFQILESGSFQRLNALKTNPKATSCLEFVKIHNIGSSNASVLYSLGYRTIKELKYDVFNSTGPINNETTLKETLENSLKYYDDLQINYSLYERHSFAENIRNIAKEKFNLKMEICGGTRRRKKLGHDLDLLFTLDESLSASSSISCRNFDVMDIGDKLLNELRQHFHFIEILKNHSGSFANHDSLPETREEKHSIQLSVIKETPTSKYRRVDFVIVPPRHWIFAILGWTGTTMFERSLRTYVDGEFTEMMEKNINKTKNNIGTSSSDKNRFKAKNPVNRIEWKINNKMIARIKMSGTKHVEIVQADGINGRPDFNSEEELFEFLHLEYLAPHEREM